MIKSLLSDPPERRMLGVDQIDALGLALLTLTRELWVVTDRQAVLEKVLKRHGVTAAEIDSFQPDDSFDATLQARRKALVDGVVAALGGNPA